MERTTYLWGMNTPKDELIRQLKAEGDRVCAWYAQRPDSIMTHGPTNAWTAGQHLLHLIKSTKPLAAGLGLPRILLRLRYGAINSHRSFTEVVQHYQSALAAGGRATGGFVPRQVHASEREVLIARFGAEIDQLCANLAKWSEKNIDRTGAPHPLMGMMTVRELMHFTIYHMQHHLSSLETKYS